MRKALFAVLALAMLAFAGLGSAQKFGVYAGYPLGLGGMYYLSEDFRIDGSILVAPGGFGLGVGADLILDRIPMAKDSDVPLDFYYGVGGAASYVQVVDLGIFSLGANGFGGLEYRIPEENLGLFVELGIGPTLAFSDKTLFFLDLVGRFGVNFY